MSTERHKEVGDLTVRFWGTRGSLPVPGPRTVRYGGNTCCVEIRLGSRLFIVDAGTGIEAAGRVLCGQVPPRVDILLSHLHHDHVAALPFFGPLFFRQCSVTLYCGNLGGQTAKAALDTLFSPPLFPVSLSEFPACVAHVGFRAGETLTFEDGLEVDTCTLKHPGGATGYRFDHGGRRVCYICDVEHDDAGPDPDLIRFCQDADLVIYDATFTEEQFAAHRGWGHSTWQAGVELCKAAAARSLAAFHHHKYNDDAALALVERDLAAALPGSFVARDGQSIAFGPRAELVASEELPLHIPGRQRRVAARHRRRA